MKPLNARTGHAPPELRRLAVGVLIMIAVSVAVWSYKTGIIRRVRNEIAYRLPFALPMTAPCPDCNIILVNLDTLRADGLPCYGYRRETMPELCGFAGRNSYFTNFFTNSSITLDSHATLFTGLFPTSHHVITPLRDRLNPDIPTLPEILSDHGYRTAYAGVTDDIMLPVGDIGRGFQEYTTLEGNDPGWAEKYTTLLPSATDSRPTFLFLHTYAPHAPYLVGKGPYRFITDASVPDFPLTESEFRVNTRPFYEFVLGKIRSRMQGSDTPESRQRNGTLLTTISRALSAGDIEGARNAFWTLNQYEQYDLYMAWYWSRIDSRDPAARAFVRDVYDERLRQIDASLMNLLAYISSPEVRRKTILVFFSDNGEGFFEHEYFDHGWNIYNEETHTPLIVSAPRVRSGKYTELVQMADLMPTILGLVGIPLNKPIDGKSMVPLLTARGTGNAYLIGQHRGTDILSIRTDRWKMYKNNLPAKKYVELYDLTNDPNERTNVLGDHLDIARLLDRQLEAILSGSPKYASEPGEFPVWIDREKRDTLIREGYF